MLSAFGTFERTNHNPRRQGLEGSYAYLNNSARPEAENIRRFTDDWFVLLPEKDREGWLGRFSKNIDVVHKAAFFELVLFAWLSKFGYEVEPHPAIAGVSGHPDFLAIAGDGSSFYLEATTKLGLTPDEVRQNHFCDQIVGEIEKIESSDFFVSLDFVEAPVGQPKLAAIREGVRTWLTTLSYDDVLAAMATEELGKFGKDFPISGGILRVEPIAKTNTRGTPEAVGWIAGLGGGYIDTQGPIQKALDGKSSKYGALQVPYVIAVNGLSEFARESHVYEAFDSLEVVHFQGGKQRLSRDDSGCFGTNAKPRKRQVSAALVLHKVDPWNFARSIPVFVANPWANVPAGPLFGECRGRYWNGKDIVVSDRDTNLGSILGLPAGWPE